METQIIKPRSYVSCLGEGLSYPLVHFTTIFRFVWPAALLSTLISVGLYVFGQHLMMKQSTMLWAILAVTGLLDLLGLSFYQGHVLWQQHRLVQLGYIPRVWPWQVAGEMKTPLLRSLLCSLVEDVLVLLSVAAAVVGILFRSLMYAGMAFVPLVLLFFLLPSMLHYLFSSDSLSASLDAFRVRYLGRLLVILLLTYLVMLLVVTVGSIPLALLTYVDYQAMVATMMGDSVALPGYFGVLGIVSLCILQFVALCSMAWGMYPLLFHWGTVTAIEREREKSLLSES